MDEEMTLGGLLSAGVLHVCYVAEDLEAATAYWAGVTGAGPFTDLGRCDIAGNQADIAFGAVGDLFVELVQPCDDGYLYNTLLRGIPKTQPCAFHHYAVRVPDRESALAVVRDQGLEVTATGPLGDDFWFAYVDLTATLGHFVELVWASAAGEAFWAEVRRTSSHRETGAT